MKSATEATRLQQAERALEVLTRENEALRTVVARLYDENVRLAESMGKSKRWEVPKVSNAERHCRPIGEAKK